MFVRWSAAYVKAMLRTRCLLCTVCARVQSMFIERTVCEKSRYVMQVQWCRLCFLLVVELAWGGLGKGTAGGACGGWWTAPTQCLTDAPSTWPFTTRHRAARVRAQAFVEQGVSGVVAILVVNRDALGQYIEWKDLVRALHPHELFDRCVCLLHRMAHHT